MDNNHHHRRQPATSLCFRGQVGPRSTSRITWVGEGRPRANKRPLKFWRLSLRRHAEQLPPRGVQFSGYRVHVTRAATALTSKAAPIHQIWLTSRDFSPSQTVRLCHHQHATLNAFERGRRKQEYFHSSGQVRPPLHDLDFRGRCNLEFVGSTRAIAAVDRVRSFATQIVSG